MVWLHSRKTRNTDIQTYASVMLEYVKKSQLTINWIEHIIITSLCPVEDFIVILIKFGFEFFNFD